MSVIQDTTLLVLKALRNVGLAHTINLMPAELSGGMQRRIVLPRRLILKPKMKQRGKILQVAFKKFTPA
ncbi:MAG: phospholipid/cholesterol/gamma-HCH transport system ATP-binding protein [Maribacter sp.]|jgi:phospholipid/cholesterol/gamma-HCH transport system ATP-binding protein